MLRLRKALEIIALGLLVGACSHPCQDLATETCALRGPGSASCATAEEMARQSGGHDHRACALALDVLKSRRPAPR